MRCNCFYMGEYLLLICVAFNDYSTEIFVVEKNSAKYIRKIYDFIFGAPEKNCNAGARHFGKIPTTNVNVSSQDGVSSRRSQMCLTRVFMLNICDYE